MHRLKLDPKIGAGPIPNDETVTVKSSTQIGAGYAWSPNPTALEVGPAGLAYDAATDVLYVASTLDNAIYAISRASTIGASSSTGKKAFSNAHLCGPVGLVLAPNGNLLASIGDAVNANATEPSEIVESTKSGQYVGEHNIDQTEGGGFGVAISAAPGALKQTAPTHGLAVVDDNFNNVTITNLPSGE